MLHIRYTKIYAAKAILIIAEVRVEKGDKRNVSSRIRSSIQD